MTDQLVSAFAFYSAAADEGGPSWADQVSAIASVFGVFAIGFVVLQIRQVNQQIHRELETQYLNRFWQLMDGASYEFKAGKSITDKDKRILLDYFQLCEDQIGLREYGRVTDGTWSFWRVDMKDFCTVPLYYNHFLEVLGVERLEDVPTDCERFKLLRQLLSTEKFDPLDWSKPKRLWHGL